MSRHRPANGFLAFVALLACSVASGQSKNTEHTFKLDDKTDRPAATLDDVGWLVGNWAGTAFGNTMEEVWNPPSAGSMVGMFKLLDEGEVVFYELLLIVEEEGSLSMKVKHFNADFSAWEDKEDYVTFRMVKIVPDEIHFSGLSFYRESDDRIRGYIVLHQDGKVREEELVYHRR